MFIYNVDDEITMRMLNVKDANRLFEITDQSRNYLRKWLPWLDETATVDDSVSFIKNGFQIYAEQRGLTAGVFYKGELVGVAGFNQFDWHNRIGFIGYWIAKNYQGYGIMTRVVQALTQYAFKELKMNRTDIRTAADNVKSQAIPQRLGYIIEGKLRQTEWLYDHYVDQVVYGMLKKDWNK